MNNKYIAPDKNLDSFTCPHCQTLSLMNFRTLCFEQDVITDDNGVAYIINNHGYDEEIYSSELKIARCHSCGKKIIWIDNEYIYPNIVAEEVNPDLPESVKQLYNEAGLIYNQSPRAACALLRLAIDRLCNELGETDRDINKNIGALVEKGLPKKVQQALDVVRVVGNKAVHPGEIAFDVDDIKTAKSLMRLINMIGQSMITDPKDIEDMYNLLPESAKESIERRDNK
ncbi:DUF4145 domain-containing protein [Prevotella histicola]|jgi:hypothetical protein|uniref:DUF4145 domain-containing protein n=1 Tax=Prevotella histicola TaxID=470565 RepID=UPI0028EB719A|nr:DUF4145 domain-containing protein [Prevotella histicola]